MKAAPSRGVTAKTERKRAPQRQLRDPQLFTHPNGLVYSAERHPIQALRAGTCILATTEEDDPKVRARLQGGGARAGHVLAQMKKLLRLRGLLHPAPADQEVWVEIAIAQYRAIEASRPKWTFGLPRWIQRYAPEIYRERPGAWLDARVADQRREGRFFSPEEIGTYLGVTREEFSAAGLWDLQPAGMTAEEREQVRRGRKAEWQREANLAAGKVKRPHAQSQARTQPWKVEGVSESTWRRRKRERRAADAGRPHA